MKQKHVDAMREARLWIGQVIVPATLIIGTIMKNQETREYVSHKYNDAKNFIKNKFQKRD